MKNTKFDHEESKKRGKNFYRFSSKFRVNSNFLRAFYLAKNFREIQNFILVLS